MSTYGTMIDRISTELGRSDLTAQIKSAIQTAIRFYERNRFYFNEFQTSFSTSSSQEYYGSADLAQIPLLVEIDSLTIDVNTSTYPVIERDWAYIDEIQTNAGYTGDPTDYVYYAQRLRFYPIPGSGRVINLSGVQKFTTLSATTDTNAWMTDGEALIRNKAKATIFGDVIRNESEEAKCAARAREEFSNLEKETFTKMSTKLRPTAF